MPGYPAAEIREWRRRRDTAGRRRGGVVLHRGSGRGGSGNQSDSQTPRTCSPHLRRNRVELITWSFSPVTSAQESQLAACQSTSILRSSICSWSTNSHCMESRNSRSRYHPRRRDSIIRFRIVKKRTLINRSSTRYSPERK